jgi:hypothetical protein
VLEFGIRGLCRKCHTDWRDWELLDKQVQQQQSAPPPNAIILLMFAIIFIAGLATGAVLFPSGRPAAQSVDGGKAALAFLLNGSGHETR